MLDPDAGEPYRSAVLGGDPPAPPDLHRPPSFLLEPEVCSAVRQHGCQRRAPVRSGIGVSWGADLRAAVLGTGCAGARGTGRLDRSGAAIDRSEHRAAHRARDDHPTIGEDGEGHVGIGAGGTGCDVLGVHTLDRTHRL